VVIYPVASGGKAQSAWRMAEKGRSAKGRSISPSSKVGNGTQMTQIVLMTAD